MNKIKVLQVVGSLRIGGAETVAMNLYRYINRDIFQFDYLVYGNNIGAYESEVKALGGQVIHIDYSYRNLNKYKEEFVDVLRNNGPYTIVHSHMMFHNSLVLSIARRFGIPITVSHAHSTNDGGTSNNPIIKTIRALYVNKARNIINNNSDLIVACGTDAGEYLYGKAEYSRRGFLLKNGIDLNKYKFDKDLRAKFRKKYNIEDKKVLGCVGHFEKVKNHSFLIDVFNQIHKLDSDTVLILLGDGSLKKEIEKKCIELGINNDVVFIGNVNNVNEWMQAMDFLLMPSLYEGIPLTLIEAQAAGLKCFVSNKVSEESNVTGWLDYLPLNEECWVSKVNQYTCYDRSTNWSDKIIKNGYDVETNVSSLQKKYCELLESKGINYK